MASMTASVGEQAAGGSSNAALERRSTSRLSGSHNGWKRMITVATILSMASAHAFCAHSPLRPSCCVPCCSKV